VPTPSAAASLRIPVSRRAVDRLDRGHLWIYRSDLGEVPEAVGRGAVVGVVDPRGRWLGQALYSTESQIALRLITTSEAAVDEDFWRRRLAAAIAVRDRLALDGTARRLVHAEADLLPSLIVDQYDDVLVVQTLSQLQCLERCAADIEEVLSWVQALETEKSAPLEQQNRFDVEVCSARRRSRHRGQAATIPARVQLAVH